MRRCNAAFVFLVALSIALFSIAAIGCVSIFTEEDQTSFDETLEDANVYRPTIIDESR